MPGAMPVTTPLVLIVAIDILLLLQVPPLAESLRVVADPAHTVATPVIGGRQTPNFITVALLLLAASA